MGAKTQIVLLVAAALLITWGTTWLMWPSRLERLDAKPEICAGSDCIAPPSPPGSLPLSHVFTPPPP
jgi:hypothetical protein